MARQGHKNVISYKSEHVKLETFAFISYAGKIYTISRCWYPLFLFKEIQTDWTGNEEKEHHPVQAVRIAEHCQFEKDRESTSLLKR